MNRLAILLTLGVLCLAGCAHDVQQLDDFSAVRIAGESVTFVSAPNRLIPQRGPSDSAVGVKTLRKGESMRLTDFHGTIVYEVLKVAPDRVVVKMTSTFYPPGLDMHRHTEIFAVPPYDRAN